MTLHSDVPPPVIEQEHDLEEALRCARAASHSRRLDTATQAALDAIVTLARAVVDRMIGLDAQLRQTRERIAALESDPSFARRSDGRAASQELRVTPVG